MNHNTCSPIMEYIPLLVNFNCIWIFYGKFSLIKPIKLCGTVFTQCLSNINKNDANVMAFSNYSG